MKKLLSIVLSICMLFSLTMGLDFTAQAATKYDDTVVKTNIKTIKKFVKKNGYISGNGNYAYQKLEDIDGLSLYYIMFLDSSNKDHLTFQIEIEVSSTGELFSIAHMDMEQPLNKPRNFKVAFWYTGDNYSDVGGHAYLDRSYYNLTDVGNFYVDYNDIGMSESDAVNAFDSVLSLAFNGWEDMLISELRLNMGSVGFKKYCTSHKYKSNTTKATTSKDGKIASSCTKCGAIKGSVKTIPMAKTVKLATTSYVYDGKAKKPSVKIKDANGKALVKDTDYTVKYASGRKNVGKYKVTITFKGNYSGTKTLYFTIVPKATTLSSVTASSKGFKAKWKKQTTQTSGYEIQYATDSNFKKNKKSVTVGKNSTTSKKVTGLKAKTKYYVRVRTYKTVSGKKIYSAWSNVKSVTTKK